MFRSLHLRHSQRPISLARVSQPHGLRSISLLVSLPAVLVPPVVFGGLVVSLWVYKCAMMVIFQNKIIYMPGVPLGAKRETLADYKPLCSGIQWQEHHRSIKTSDGKLLSSVTATINPTFPLSSNKKHILVVYFQGNASSTPPRLPHLSAILTALSKDISASYTFLIPSYRGYWTSTGSPSQAGIEKDLSAIFTLLEQYTHATDVILWGQSIGCGIAMKGWADYLKRGPISRADSSGDGKINVTGVILETPFVSVSNMLRALYPQKWLPYRYLSVFLRSTWDVRASAEVVRGRVCKANEAGQSSQSGKTDRLKDMKHSQKLRVLLLSAARDEVVPAEETASVEEVVEDMVGRDCVRSVVVPGALHVECVARPHGRSEVVAFLKGLDEGDALR